MTRILPSASLAACMLLTACGHSLEPSAEARSEAAEPPAASGSDAYRYLQAYTGHAPYRTGTEGDAQVSAWIASGLRALGYATQIEEHLFTRYVPRRVELKVADFSPAVFPLYYSGRTASEGVSASLVDIGDASPQQAQAARGAIAWVEVPLGAGGKPRAIFETAIVNAAAAGALGLVASLQGPENEIVAQNVNSQAGLCGFPVLLTGKHDGERLKALSGSIATFVLDASVDEQARFSNVIATRAAADAGTQDLLLIGTPKNGWHTSAAERGGGVGAALSLARWYAEQPAPTQNLGFIFTGGHEVGFLGLQAHLRSHPELAERISSYVHLGASIAARDFTEAGDTVVENPAGNSITQYVSENPLLQAIAQAAFASNGVVTSSLPPAVVNPGEQSAMYNAGVPIAAISASHFYFHTPRDLPDLTTAERLDPVVRAYRSMIDQLLALSPATLRGTNALAAALAGEPGAAEAACLVAPGPSR